MPKLPICPHCGSKLVTPAETFFRCDECHTDFGREPMSDDGRILSESITGIRFRYGDVISGSVRLRFIQDGDTCLYEVYDSNEGGIDKVAGVMNHEEWTAFRHKLFDDLYLFDWDKQYIPVNDGREIRGNNEWEFAVAVSEDEEYIYRGVDAYPVYWNRFLKALDPFFDQLKHE